MDPSDDFISLFVVLLLTQIKVFKAFLKRKNRRRSKVERFFFSFSRCFQQQQKTYHLTLEKNSKIIFLNALVFQPDSTF